MLPYVSKALFLGLAILLVLGLILASSSTTVTEASTSNSNLETLIRELYTRVVEEAGGEITFHFVSPVAGAVTELTMPGRTFDDRLLYTITEIGEDYMCYRDNRGEVFFIFCVPFANIASVAYTQLP